MSAYLIVQVNVKDATTYERYKKLAPPTIAQYGGRYLTRGGHTETLDLPLLRRAHFVLHFHRFHDDDALTRGDLFPGSN